MECHRSEGVGPFPLETWADVVGHAPMIEQVVQAGTMPPWFAAPVAGQHASLWANDRSLSESDRSDLLTWLRSDRLEGDVADAPLARVFPEAWTMGTPDLIVQIPAPIQVKATGTMPYQFVTAETTLEEDKWVQGYEIVPTDRSVVHHVIVNVHEKGSGRARDREEGLGGVCPRQRGAGLSGRLCSQTSRRRDCEFSNSLHAQRNGYPGPAENGPDICQK